MNDRNALQVKIREHPGCTGKIPHPTEEDARQSAKQMKKRWGGTFQYYACAFCKSYHVGRPIRKAR